MALSMRMVGSCVLQVVRPIAGGMKRHVHSLAKGLVQAGYKVIFASPRGPFAEELEREGFHVSVIPLRGAPHPLYDYFCIKKISELLRKKRVYLIHTHGYRAGWVGRIAARLAGTPAVVHTAHSSLLHNPWPSWKAKIFLRLDGYLARFTDQIITVSNDLRRELIEQGKIPPALVTTIYNGLKFDSKSGLTGGNIRTELGVPPQTLLVGTIARLAPQKGISVFIKAASCLKHRADVRFIVVGDGPLRQAIEREADLLGVPVIFTGFRKDIPDILRGLDVFVLPSLTEGLPYVILEAMGSGLPIVATRVGGIPEVIRDGETGILVPPGSEEDLVRGLVTLLDNENLRRNLGAAARLHVMQNFREETMIQQTLNVYGRLLHSKTSQQPGAEKESSRPQPPFNSLV